MADYSKMTDDEFNGILKEIVDGMSGAEILAIAGVYEVLREELNNEVLERWAGEHPELAWPEDDTEGEVEESWACECCGDLTSEHPVECSVCHATVCPACAVSVDDVYPELCPSCLEAMTGE